MNDIAFEQNASISLSFFLPFYICTFLSSSVLLFFFLCLTVRSRGNSDCAVVRLQAGRLRNRGSVLCRLKVRFCFTLSCLGCDLKDAAHLMCIELFPRDLVQPGCEANHLRPYVPRLACVELCLTFHIHTYGGLLS